MYILEQRSSCGTQRVRPSWPRSGHRLNPILASPYEHASCCHAQPSIQPFMTAVQVSPQRLLLSGWLLTNVQVNITTMLHDTGHTCIYITLAFTYSCSSFYTSSIFLGRLAVLHSLCPLQYSTINSNHINPPVCHISNVLIISTSLY